MVKYLSDYYEQDKSALIKRSLSEMYEDVIDRMAISEYETREKKGKIKFIASEDIITMLKKTKKPRHT
jgi:hypothetical protein